jgi:hypothetical protein
MGRNSQTRLADIDDELRRAVFMAVYQSRKQRLRRFVAMLLLVAKHLLRGFIILWPVYVVFLALLLLSDMQQYLWYFLTLLPGLFIWLMIYIKGARLEYNQSVNGLILGNDFIKQLFLN